MTISYRYRHFPGPIIQHAVWLYCRFTLSLREVEDLMAERGVEVSYETIRRWVARFGPEIASYIGHILSGISTKCSSPSVGGGCIYGGPWIRTVKCLMSSSKRRVTSRPLAGCYVSC